PEWWVFRELARRARPDIAARIGLEDAAAIRREIGATIPLYAGIETLAQKGDALQWGGRALYADGRFATSDGKAHFAPVQLASRERRAGTFVVSTRRGKQFNSMVQREIDPLTGLGRHDILIGDADLARLRLRSGARVRLRSASGVFEGTLRAAPIREGSLEVHWPEGNVLLSGTARDPDSLEPDYNAIVTLEAVADTRN